MTKSMALIVLVFVICWTPFVLYMHKVCRKKGKVTDGTISKMASSTHVNHVEISEKRSMDIDLKNSSYKKR